MLVIIQFSFDLKLLLLLSISKLRPSKFKSIKIKMPFKKEIIFLLLVILLLSNTSFAQRTNPFLSITGTRGYPAIQQAVPYEKARTYFDYIDSSNVTIYKVEEQNTFSLYFFIENPLQELGLRFISPLPESFSPNKGDQVTYSFENADEPKVKGFNASIALNRIEINNTDTNFIQLIDETPLKFKERNNQTFRITDKNFKPGWYQLQIISKEKEFPFGYFALQIGSIPVIKFPELFKSLSDVK